MADVQNRDEKERKFARMVARILGRQIKDIIELLGSPPNLNNLPFDFWPNQNARFSPIFPFIEDIALEQAKMLIDNIPLGVDWYLVNEAAAAWADGYSFRLVTGINSTSRKGIQTAVTRYFRDAQTLEQIEQEIALYKEFTQRAGRLAGPARVETIAVTEITRASVEGEQMAVTELGELGVTMQAKWVTNNDEIVHKCPICWPLHNRPADGYEPGRRPFWRHPNGGFGRIKSRYNAPPDAHPHDRCWVSWELPEA